MNPSLPSGSSDTIVLCKGRVLFYLFVHFPHSLPPWMCSLRWYACNLIFCKWHWLRHHWLLWFLFLSTVFSRPTHVAMCTSVLFCPVAVWDSVVCIYHVLPSHSAHGGQPNCLQLLNISDEASVNLYDATYGHVWEFRYMPCSRRIYQTWLTAAWLLFTAHIKSNTVLCSSSPTSPPMFGIIQLF